MAAGCAVYLEGTMKITVLGAGMVGSALAKELAEEAGYSVTVVDLNQHALAKLEAETPIRGIRADHLP